jgi:hypothetical protein
MSDLQDLITLRHEERFPEALKLGEELLTFLPNLVRLLEELVLIFYFSNQKEKAYRCVERILLLRPVDKNVLARALYNVRLFYDLYTNEQWTPLTTLPSTTRPLKQIILTVTTCKRFKLFERTVRSFLRSCIDLDWIATFICVDDNSSASDRLLMKQRYPFFKYIWKTKNQKGHCTSMQLITQELQSLRVPPRFILHLEDDWEFLSRVSIQDLIEILYEGYPEGVRQVAFNRNYAELPSQVILGGEERQTKSNLTYYIHEHVQTDEQRLAFDLKHGTGMTCHYWPHFTLQPSIFFYSILNEISFQPGPSFEMTFARRYAEQGWKTAFLPASLCRHIGKLLGDTDVLNKNAYQLNDEQR